MSEPMIETIVPGVTTGHVVHHEWIAAEWNRRQVLVPCEVDGTTDNTSLIMEYVGDATPGDVLRFPRGPIRTDPIVIPKCLHLVGGGKFSTRFVPPASATTDPVIAFDLTVDSGFGIYDNYGPSLTGIGLDLRGTPNATGVAMVDNADWYRLRDVSVNGGDRSIVSDSPNGGIEDVVLIDATDCYLYITRAGLELDVRHAKLTTATVTTDAYFKVEITGPAGSFGALYMDNIQGNSGGTVNKPFVFEAENAGTFFAFLRQVVLDNCSGPAELTRVSDVTMFDGYLNCAVGVGTAVVLINESHNLKFRGNKYFGGAGGGTYEFVGPISYGFDSERNTCNTTPAYKISTATKPTEIHVDDWMPGATDVGQITNDVAWFQAASQRKWGPKAFMDRLTLSETPTLTFPAAFEGAMVAGSVTLPAENVLSAYSRFIPFRVTQGGTLGDLTVSSINEGADTVTITSTSPTETSTIGYIRYELPH